MLRRYWREKPMLSLCPCHGAETVKSPTRPGKALGIRGHRSGMGTTARVLLRTPGGQHMPGVDELTSTFPPRHVPSTRKTSGESQCGHRKCRVAPSGKDGEFNIIVMGQFLALLRDRRWPKSGPRAGLAASAVSAAPITWYPNPHLP